jgi:predicted regulator of Ras-like GTPase activity (Roadblock/LC7/MglB family)
MLSTLFGDLGGPRPAPGSQDDAESAGFAPTAVLEEGVEPFSVHAQIDDPHAQNLFVTGSPAQAIREHFRHTRADLGEATQMLTLLDVSRQQAPALLKALADTTGTPVERLHLREQGTLRTLALIERATVHRRAHDTLKVYHAETRRGGMEEAEVCAALMERSQLSAVLLDRSESGVALEALHRVHEAVQHSTWRCPVLAFVVPAEAEMVVQRIRVLPWPARLRVEIVNGPLRGSSALWNALLGLFERRRFEPSGFGRWAGGTEAPDAAQAARLLAPLLQCEGVQGCALVDGAGGQMLAGETPLPQGLAPDLARASLACSLALRAQQHAARTMGLPAVEELTVTAGDHQHVIRAIASRPGFFVLAMLDRRRTNVALVRFKLRDLERALG